MVCLFALTILNNLEFWAHTSLSCILYVSLFLESAILSGASIPILSQVSSSVCDLLLLYNFWVIHVKSSSVNAWLFIYFCLLKELYLSLNCLSLCFELSRDNQLGNSIRKRGNMDKYKVNVTIDVRVLGCVFYPGKLLESVIRWAQAYCKLCSCWKWIGHECKKFG